MIGRVIPEDEWERTPLYEAVRTSHMLEWHDDMGTGHKAPTGYTLVTQNVSFSKEFYLAVGGFDPKLRLGEDSELGLRFEFAGGTFRVRIEGVGDPSLAGRVLRRVAAPLLRVRTHGRLHPQETWWRPPRASAEESREWQPHERGGGARALLVRSVGAWPASPRCTRRATCCSVSV